MKKPIFKGAAVALVTPFNDKGVDFEKLSELCEFQIKNGTDAILVCGTTGEASTMPDDEHMDTIKCVIDTVSKRVPVIAGVGSNDTLHAVKLSEKAARLGSDALLHVTPYYNKASQEGLYRHFKAVAEATDLPVMLYNVPSRTCCNIDPETTARLSEIETVNSIKECRIDQAADVANLCGDNINLYTGEDGMILPMLSFGGQGVVSVLANVVPNLTHRMTAAYFEGNVQEATALQIKLTPLIHALFCDVNPIPVKAALNLMGMAVGSCRLPLCDTSPANLEQIRKALADLDLLA